uniref:Uncharacterized protein n=1 Tax=Anguilla anguilla TaxID=7936 RepID=A0A0E9W8R8_ANGAN
MYYFLCLISCCVNLKLCLMHFSKLLGHRSSEHF